MYLEEVETNEEVAILVKFVNGTIIPVRFRRKNNLLVIIRHINAIWHQSDGGLKRLLFAVEGDDGVHYTLCYTPSFQRWMILLQAQPPREL